MSVLSGSMEGQSGVRSRISLYQPIQAALFLSSGTKEPAPQSMAAILIHWACSAGIQVWKGLPVCWICYSHRAIQKIIPPKITHSNSEGNLLYAFIGAHHSSIPAPSCLSGTLKYPFALQLIISHNWIIISRKVKGQVKYEVELVYF